MTYTIVTQIRCVLVLMLFILAAVRQSLQNIYEEMQEVFSLHENKITNIAFSGFGRASGSYPWHKDSMDVFLVQVISTVGLKVEHINNEEPFDFEPGMFVYLPRGTHHQVFPRVSRVSFSFGVEGDPDPSKYY